MTTRLAHRPAQQAQGLATAMAVGSVFATLGSLGYVALNFVGSPREAYSHPLNTVACTLATLGAAMLAFSLVRWRTRLPAWAVTTAAAGLLFASANAWFFGTGIVAIAGHADDQVFDAIGTSAWVFVMAAPKMVLCLVGFLGLALAGWRHGTVPRVAASALAVAGLLSLVPPHPPGLLFAALAFFLISRNGVEERA